MRQSWLAWALLLAIAQVGAQESSGSDQGTGGDLGTVGTAVIPEVTPTTAAQTTQQQTTQEQPVTSPNTTPIQQQTSTTAPVVQTTTQQQTVNTNQQTVTQQTTQQQNTAPVVPTSQVQTTLSSTVIVNGQTVVSSVTTTFLTQSASGMVTSTRPTSVAMQVQTNDAGSVLIVVEGLTTTVAPESASVVQASISSASLAGTLNTDQSASSGGGGSSRAWVIPVAVVCGVLGACILAWLAFRLYKSRSTGLDNDADFIKWPELKSNSTDEVLMPQGARHLSGAGIDFGSDEGDDHHSQKTPMTASRNSSMLFGSPVMGSSSSSHQPPAPQQAYYDQRMSYYDPYLGQQGQQQEAMVERRPSNMSYATSQVHSLPPGAASSIHRPFSPAGATTSGSEFGDAQYRSTTPVPQHPPVDEPLLDRSGTVRSVGNSFGTRLGIANPSEE